MKRGFLNSKKFKDQPLYDGGGDASKTMPTVTTVKDLSLSGPKTLSEPVVGTAHIQHGPMDLEPYSVCRIPSVNMTTKSNEPSSTCIARASTCAAIAKTPGYYTPIPPTMNPTGIVLIKPAPDMGGVGLFTKRSIKAHQVVFSERPLLVFPKALPIFHVDGLSEAEKEKESFSNFEDVLQQTLSTMTKEDVDAYMGLSNALPDCPQLYGIARTNSFGASDFEETNLQEGHFGYAAVGRFASRINHRCSQNIWMRFDIPTFAIQIIAVRNIKAGDQLFHCYCQENRSAKERQRQLATYGFTCQCKACVNATPESDRLREDVDDRLQKIINESQANPQFGLPSLDPLLELEKDIIQEGLDIKPKFVDLLSIIVQAYSTSNNGAKAKEYYKKMNKYMGK